MGCAKIDTVRDPFAGASYPASGRRGVDDHGIAWEMRGSRFGIGAKHEGANMATAAE